MRMNRAWESASAGAFCRKALAVSRASSGNPAIMYSCARRQASATAPGCKRRASYETQTGLVVSLICFKKSWVISLGFSVLHATMTCSMTLHLRHTADGYCAQHRVHSCEVQPVANSSDHLSGVKCLSG